MKKRFIPLFLLLAVVLTAAALAWTGEAAYAQGCTDPTGNPIPCPNPDKKTPTPVPPRATATFTPTATALPTETPLPLSNPSEAPEADGASWTGSCKLSDKTCPLIFSNACSHVKGTVEIESTTDDTVTLKCTVPLVLVPTPMAITNPTDDGIVELQWKGTCSLEQSDQGAAVYENCLSKLYQACTTAGGTYTDESPADTNTTTVTCTLPDGAEFVPTPLPLAMPEGNLIGTCNAADGNVQECMDELERQCEDGTLVIKVDLYGGDGTSYNFYCIPHKPTFPPGGWLPWITGFFGLLIGMLLPAVQKIRDAASRTERMPNNKNPDLMKSNEDQDPTAQKKAKRTEAEFSNKSEPTSQTREHVLLAKQDGEQGNSRPYRLFGDADGDSPPPPPPPPPQNNAPAEEEGMQLKAKRAEIAPQTREHILLANQPTDPSEAKSGSGGQKPPPPPPPPPPSGPTHTSVPISAGKPSLQDFHFSTMDPDENASLSGAKEQSDGIGGVRVASGDVDAAREQGDESAETGQPLKDRGSQLPPIGAGDGI